MTLSIDNILLRHNYISMPAAGDHPVSQEVVTTIMYNLSYYGRALNVEGYRALTKSSRGELADWWMVIEQELKEITGDNRKIGDFVVYKNFPAEVLDKSAAEYWLPQILMYWGLPNELFTEPALPRPAMKEKTKPIVLKMAKKETLQEILNSLLKSPARWKQEELDDVLLLSTSFSVNLSKLVFKENMISLVLSMMQNGRPIGIKTATDVLRLAAGLSGGDVSLREKPKFISFKKPMRRFLLSLLDNCSNLSEDVARRAEMFKRLLHQLHPGDYKRAFPRVWAVNNDLYNDRLLTFNSQVEGHLQVCNSEVLSLLSERPGDFRRRLVHTLEMFGSKAARAFCSDEVLDKLTTFQIASLRRHLETVNSRTYRVFPPKGNWNKVQIGKPRSVESRHVKVICKALGKQLAKRVPSVKVLDSETSLIKLPNNGGSVSPYARGTVFPIPDDVEFIRTASYWQIVRTGNIWFDNGWNFFDANWKSLGACCWTDVKFHNNAAVFSGDPTNSKEMEGKAAQLIDLYPSKLRQQDVRYAVWSILCYSHIPFSQADDVFAALQWGKDAQKGNLFEPSRCQLSFPITDEQQTKFICLIDLEKNEMVYLDANLHGEVSSAARNCSSLEKNMPPFMEYINSLPSVHDLFRESVDKSGNGAYILYSDKETALKNVDAYVFKPENKTNKFKSVDINSLL